MLQSVIQYELFYDLVQCVSRIVLVERMHIATDLDLEHGMWKGHEVCNYDVVQ